MILEQAITPKYQLDATTSGSPEVLLKQGYIQTEIGTFRSPEEQQIVDLLAANQTLRHKMTDLKGDITWLLPDDVASKIWNAEYVTSMTAYLVTFYGEPDSPQTLAESLGLELPVQEGTSDQLKARYAVDLVFAAEAQGKMANLSRLVLEKFGPLLSGDAPAEPIFHPNI